MRQFNFNIVRSLELLKIYIAEKNIDKAIEECDILKKYIHDKGLEAMVRLRLAPPDIENIKSNIFKNNMDEVDDMLDAALERLYEESFQYLCPQNWQSLYPTENEHVKFCKECSRNVYKVKTPAEAQKRSKLGQCIFLNLLEEQPNLSKKACQVAFDLKHGDIVGQVL